MNKPMNNLFDSYRRRDEELVVARTIVGSLIVGAIGGTFVGSLVTYILCR